jgi:hypothetical protein
MLVENSVPHNLDNGKPSEAKNEMRERSEQNIFQNDQSKILEEKYVFL